MNILIVGGGGREHAILQTLIRTAPKGTNRTYHAIPGNGGIAADGAICNPDIAATDLYKIVNYAKDKTIDFAIVAPDDPLVGGLVDMLEAEGVPCFGPTKDAALIEGSKAFSKELMRNYRIPTGDFRVFARDKAAVQYIERKGKFPVVIKADGLALGKGVVIVHNMDEAKQTIFAIMRDRIFGNSGTRIVVEEFMTGPEVSVLAFADGKTVVPMIAATDHKRAFDNDEGPNTGGMGVVSPVPYYTPEIAAECMEKIFIPTVQAMSAEGREFKGVLFFGLMKTNGGVKVIEYNARFGDPEAQVVLAMLETDLLDIMLATATGNLSDINIQWKKGAAACVVMASGGYPIAYETGLPITGLDKKGGHIGAEIYHSGTHWQEGFITSGGRVLGVTATGETLSAALKTVYSTVECISFEGVHYRKDIGALGCEVK